MKGIKVIMPRNDDPREYGEPGHIAEIVRNHGLIGVKVGQVILDAKKILLSLIRPRVI